MLTILCSRELILFFSSKPSRGCCATLLIRRNLKMSKSRKVVKKVLSVEQGEGVGARVRRSVGRPEVCENICVNFDVMVFISRYF